MEVGLASRVVEGVEGSLGGESTTEVWEVEVDT